MRDFNRLASVFCLLIEAAEKKRTAESAEFPRPTDSAADVTTQQAGQQIKHTSGLGLGQVGQAR